MYQCLFSHFCCYLVSRRFPRKGSWFTFHSHALEKEMASCPLRCSGLENPRDRGAWWAPVSGVAQSRTRLKWLSSSSIDDSLFVTLKSFWMDIKFLVYLFLQYLKYVFHWNKAYYKKSDASLMFSCYKWLIQFFCLNTNMFFPLSLKSSSYTRIYFGVVHFLWVHRAHNL